MLFREIIGQEKAVNSLRQALGNDKLAHAYLFIGPNGVGKKLTALTLAQAIFCRSGQDEPCQTCSGCLKTRNNSHPDLHFISGEEISIKIDQIRRLQKWILLRGLESDKKVAILDGAETMTTEAANAFLKTLEEPPANSVIILITPKPSALLPTVISRCHLLRFYSLPEEKVVEIMIARLGLPETNARLIPFLMEGGKEHRINLQASSLESKMNKAARLIELVENDGISCLFDFSRDLSEDRDEVEEILGILLTAGRRALLRRFDYLEGKDGEDFMWPVFKKLSRQACLEIIDIIQNARAAIAKNGHVRLALEVMVLELRRIR